MEKEVVLKKEEDIHASMKDLEGDFLKVDKELNEYTIGEYAIIFSMGLLWITVTITVLGRMLFRSGGLGWSEELGRMLLICVAFLGLGVVKKLDMHFKVDKITGVPERAYWALDIVSCLVEIVIMLILFVKGLELMWMTRLDITPALQWPISVFYTPLPLGAIGMIYHSAQKLVALLKGGRNNG